jgi:hypothetical protein
LTCIGAAYGGVRLVSFGWPWSWHDSLRIEEPLDYDMQDYKTNPQGTYSSLDIYADGCELYVVEGTEFKIECRYDSRYWTLDQNDRGGKLSVELRPRPRSSFGIGRSWLLNNEIATLTITYPRQASFDSIKITGNAIKASTDKLSADDINISFDAGDINLAGVDCETLSINLNAGSIRINEASVSKWASIKTDAGQLTMNNAKLTDMDLKINVGSFDFNGIIKGRNSINLDAGSANLSLDQTITDLDISYNIDAGDLAVDSHRFTGLGSNGRVGSSSGSVKVDIKVSVGSVKITTR